MPARDVGSLAGLADFVAGLACPGPGAAPCTIPVARAVAQLLGACQLSAAGTRRAEAAARLWEHLLTVPELGKVILCLD